MIIGYCRVSSREQAENSHALEQQEARVRTLVDDIVSDVESGSSDTRLNFQKLWGMIADGLVSAVVVTRLDRLTRSLPMLRKFLDHCQAHQVALQALDDNIDTHTAMGKFHINMLGALAEMEVDRLSERTKHGWQHLRDSKRAVNPPFGYIKVDEKFQLDHEPFLCLLDGQVKSRAMLARECVEAFLEARSLRRALRKINTKYGIRTFAHQSQQGVKKGGRVAQKVFRFSPGGFSLYLKNPVLQGHICYFPRSKNRQIIYNTHPDQKLISEEEAKEIESILSDNRQRKGFGSTAPKYPLSGLVICAECRSTCYSQAAVMNYHRAKRLGIPKVYRYYFQCKNWRDRSCSNKTVVRQDDVEAVVIEALCQRANEVSQTLETPDEEPVEVKELKQQLQQLQQIPNPNSAITSAIAELQAQIHQLRIQSGLQNAQAESEKSSLQETFSDPVFWDTYLKARLSPGEVREIYRRYVDRVLVKDGEVVQVILKV